MFEAKGGQWADAELQRSAERIPWARLAEGFEGLSSAQARLAYAQSAAAVQALLDLGAESNTVAATEAGCPQAEIQGWRLSGDSA